MGGPTHQLEEVPNALSHCERSSADNRFIWISWHFTSDGQLLPPRLPCGWRLDVLHPYFARLGESHQAWTPLPSDSLHWEGTNLAFALQPTAADARGPTE
jgi:hypothetical protein